MTAHPDGCDGCGAIRELYHYEATVEGNPFDFDAICDECNTKAMAWDAAHDDDAPQVGPFHAELQALIENSGNPILAMHLPPAMIELAEGLLALPEESVAALVAAAQSMTEAASFGR